MEAINMFKYSRTSTLILLPKLEEKFWDIQPDGFPNTIRWNAGHIYVTAEDFLNEASPDFAISKPKWMELFLDGTRPSEWTGDIPSKDEIIDALKEQESRLVRYFETRLKDKAVSTRDVNGLKLDTNDASLQFVTWHEGIHLGIVKSIRDALK
ncbi:DinB family protein [Virgibacillus sp. W0430]|uniref:DinB family protein n=1 Tax=Virgibacillus sp. W0430 TaxID=3391580 RepID=UPI003F44FEFA